MEDFIKKAGVLVEAIPYIHSFRQKVFVIKYGGSILEDEKVRKNIFEDIIFLSYVGIRTILVHGGGPHISSRLKTIGKEAIFHEGIRVTDQETLQIVTEELDKLNTQIVQEIRDLHGNVTGLKGYENVIHVEKKKAARELGFVGTITSIERNTIDQHLHQGHITVVSPMGVSVEQQPHNVNADEVASAIAISLNAEKLVFFTNVHGVLKDANNPESLISSLTLDEIEGLINQGIISKGMIPKVNSGCEAIRGGVHKTHIIDARLRHALLLEIFTDKGIGTQILKDKE
jgi:acetylglutamate kinase